MNNKVHPRTKELIRAVFEQEPDKLNKIEELFQSLDQVNEIPGCEFELSFSLKMREIEQFRPELTQ